MNKLLKLKEVHQRSTLLRKIPLIMRLTLVLLFVFAFQIQAKHAHSQETKISLDVKNSTVEKILQTIEAKSDYYFLYSNQLINVDRKVSVNVDNESISSILDNLFSSENIAYEVKGTQIILYPKDKLDAKKENVREIAQQEKTITGVVVDAEGEPVIGANIIIKGTSSGTITDFDGNFSLKVPNDAVLRISYIGFLEQEISTAGKKEFSITLIEDTHTLDELVVVGYGVQKKVNLTGAISQVTSEDISLGSSANVTSSLQGLMPGLNIQVNSGDPTANPDINIRGFNSINGGSPLVLVDGIEGSMSRLNPNDIESVTVLKDAASAAIYGARGSFGVILITTKSGKSGEIVVNYSNNFSWTTPTTRTDFVSDPYEYGKAVDAALFGYNGTSYTRYNDMDWALIKMVSKGEIEPFHELQSDGTYKFFYNTNWYDYLFKKWQPSSYHNISVSGGSDRIKTYLSGRIYERETIQNIIDADMTRFNLKANITFKANDWLEISNNIKFSNEKDEDYGGYRNGYGGIWSTTTWYDLFPFLPNKIDGIPTDIGRDGSGGQGGAAAMEDANNWRRWDTDEFVNTFRVKLNPIKGLDINFDYSNLIETTSRTYRYNKFEYLTTNRLEMQTVGIDRLGEWRWKDKYNALNLFGTYSFDIAKKHNFKTMLGFNQEEFDRDRVAAQSEDLLIRDLANLSLGTEMYAIEGSALLWAIQGYFGRFNYDYEGKYLLEVNARYDGSSRFPKDSRWGFFPSVSVGWQLNRENFWEAIEDAVSSTKIRVSYGKLGNQNIGVNTFQELMKIGRSSWIDNGTRLTYAGAPNPLPRVVTWETTKTINLGLDVGVLNNKLMASLDVYNKDVDGMYLPGEPLPAVFGASEPRENYASLRNQGFEVSLTYNNSFDVAGSPLRISATGSISNFFGKITKYDNPQGLMSTYWEGQRLGEIWGYHVDGQFQSDEEAAAYQSSFKDPSASLGKVYKYILNTVQNSEWSKLRGGDLKYVDTNQDGRIDKGNYTLDNHGDLRPIGNAMPSFPFGFSVNASWRNIDLSASGNGIGRQHWYPTGDIFWGTYQRPYLSFIRKDLLSNAWTPETPNNTYPQIYRGYASLGDERSMYEMNDYYLTNIGYLRLKNLTIGYTLPKEITEKVYVQKLRLYVTGENILTWRFGNLTKYVDPEQAGSAINYSNPGDAVGRADLRDYPMGKTYSVGVNITL